MFRILKIAFIVFLLNSCTSKVFKQALEVSDSTNPVISSIDSIVIQNMNQYNIPGLSVGVVYEDSIYYAKGYGVTDVDKYRRVTDNTIFHTASISKLFTATAIINLVNQNLIALDDKMVDILPNLKYSDNRISAITIKNLLNHTSGLPDIRNYNWKRNNQADDSLEKYILDYKLKLIFEPGTSYGYSNLGYNILGYIVEVVSKNTFDDYMKENVLNKSGMFLSDFRHYVIADTLTASPHSKKWISKNVYKRKVYPYTREHAPSSTLNSSARELSMWMVSFLKSITEHDTYAAMLEPNTDHNPYIGLGFQLSNISNNKTIGHYGGDRGFRSYLIMIPSQKIGLVVLANADFDEDFRQNILHPIAKLMLEMNQK